MILADGIKELKPVDLDADGGQGGMWCVVLSDSLRVHQSVPPDLFVESEEDT
jgi:hypothetical protein